MKTFARLLTFCRNTLTVALLTSGVLASTTASAAVFTWSGGGANTSWSTTANWSGGTAPTTGNDLRFNNSTRTTNINNIGSLSIGTITFANPAGAFTISGSAINLGSITNSSANTQTLSLGVIQSTSGTYDASSNITLSGSLSGSGNISKTGAGTLALNGASKSGYTGTVTVSNGTLSFGTAGMLNGNVIMQADTTLATSFGGNLTLKSLEISGSNVTLPNNTLAFVNGGLTNSTGSQLTLNNNVTLSAISTINAGSGGMTLNGIIQGSGTTTSIGTGLLEITNSGNLPSGSFIVQAGTTRLTSGFGASFVVANGAALESSNGGNATVSSITMENGSSLRPGGPDSIGSIFASNNVTLASTSTVGFDIGGTGPSLRAEPGTDYDQVVFAADYQSGVLTYDGFVSLNFRTSTTFDNGAAFDLFNPGEVGTFTGNLVGINPTTTTGGSPYDGLTFTTYESFNEADKNFLSSYYLEKFGVSIGAGDWISSWNGAGEQRLVFSQSTGTLTVVPEPSTIVFAGIGIAMFGWSTWTRRRAKSRRQAIEAAIA
jgi:autotransporter-associated beta strand protein